MKRLLLGLLLVAITMTALAQEKKLINGYDGGMLLHTGWLKKDIAPINYTAKGMPMGIGGVIRLHLGEHLRVGTEGYVSTLHVKDNGSYIKLGWGGLLVDGCWRVGRWMPYCGLSVGGGGLTTCVMMEGDINDWENEDNLVFNKSLMMIVDPYIGCDFIATEALHITVKCDWINGFSKEKFYMPQGPRLYLGFIFFH